MRPAKRSKALAINLPSLAGCLSLPRTQLVLGTLLLPDQPMRSNQAVPSAPAGSDRHCILYAQPPAPEGQQQQQAPVLLLSCQYDVPEERAHAVCRALLAEASHPPAPPPRDFFFASARRCGADALTLRCVHANTR